MKADPLCVTGKNVETRKPQKKQGVFRKSKRVGVTKNQKTMKRIFLIATMLLTLVIVNAQSTFTEMTDVIKFMENKTFYNSEMNTELEFGYLSSYNTYGIKLKSNKSGRTMYFINCDIEAYGSFADVAGMSPSDGSNFKFRLYKTKIIVGVGEQKQATFYLKED